MGKCDANHASLNDCGHWTLWVLCISCAFLVVFYIWRLYVSWKTIKSKRSLEGILSLAFWVCLIINPAFCLYQFASHNILRTKLARYLFIVLRPFSIYLPFVLISYNILLFVSKISNPYKPGSNTRINGIVIVLYIYVTVLIVGSICMFFNLSLSFLTVADTVATALHIIAFSIFVCTSSLALASFREEGITGLPKNFFKVLVTGLNVIVVMHLMCIILQCTWTWWLNLSDIGYKRSLNAFPGSTLFLHTAYELFGFIMPSFLLSLGIIYINNAPESAVTSLRS